MERPAFHAALNATAAVLLVLGWLAIRGRGPWRAGRDERAHKHCMLAAVAVSTVFLASYLQYHAQVGSVPFWGGGGLKALYLGILLPHTAGAVVQVPLIAVTLTHALRGRLAQHRRLARWTLPLWLWVSVSGVAVWVLNFGLRPAP